MTSNPSSSLAMVPVSNSATEVSMSEDKTARIRELNDQLRTTGAGGMVVLTSGVQDVESDIKEELFTKMRTNTDFTPNNDPHQEHDFGSVDVGGQTFFWKIDYYDQKLEAGSEDPSDPHQTARVMTIMLAEEY